MIKHLSEPALKWLLALYNEVWTGGHLPLSWKAEVIIPIKKPGKDPIIQGNYTPIALTAHVCNPALGG